MQERLGLRVGLARDPRLAQAVRWATLITLCWRTLSQPSLPISSDLRLAEGLLHLLEELQLVSRLLQLALQDLAPDAPCGWVRKKLGGQAAEPAALQSQGRD